MGHWDGWDWAKAAGVGLLIVAVFFARPFAMTIAVGWLGAAIGLHGLRGKPGPAGWLAAAGLAAVCVGAFAVPLLLLWGLGLARRAW